MVSYTFYPNLPIFLHRYICHICDILQLWLHWAHNVHQIIQFQQVLPPLCYILSQQALFCLYWNEIRSKASKLLWIVTDFKKSISNINTCMMQRFVITNYWMTSIFWIQPSRLYLGKEPSLFRSASKLSCVVRPAVDEALCNIWWHEKMEEIVAGKFVTLFYSQKVFYLSGSSKSLINCLAFI